MDDLKDKVQQLIQKTDPDKKRQKIRELEAESSKPDFWQDYQTAGKKMKELADLQEEIKDLEMLEELIENGMREEAELLYEKMKFNLFLSGPYDKGDAILTIHSGQGGVEAMDWAEMLWRMYTRYAEQKGWGWEELDRTSGDEAGIKTSTLNISGKYAYGFLKGEAGTHRLVRQSPFNADNLRQTSFALVEVLPVVNDSPDVQIKDEDIEFEAFRSGGHGGQNVNKVSTAVRIKHLPSGIVVTCQTERYQNQNREYAMKILRAKLWEIKEKERVEKEKALKGEHKIAGWGNQIRSYVLHPYHMVKDLRTDYETGNTEAVLNGEIDGFIEAEMKLNG